MRIRHSFDVNTVPKEWSVIPCGVFFKEKSIKNTEGEVNLSVYRDYGVILKDSRDDNHNKVSEDTSNYKLVEPGDFVLNKMKGWSGSLGVSDYRGIVSPSYTVLEPGKKIHNKYFHYLLRSESYRQMYESLSYGVRIGQWELRYHDFKQIPSLYPPLEEQKLIARYLDKKTEQIDRLVERIQKKIELLKEQRTSLINQCVTKGLNPNVEMKDSGVEWIGEIPGHWMVKKLPWVCFFQEGPGLRNWQFTDEGTPVVCVTNIKPSGLTFENYQRYISNDEYESSYKHFTVEDGDLLMASSGNSFGKVCRYNGEFEKKFILNTSTIRLHSHDESVLSTNYLKSFIQSEIFQRQIRILITGAAQPNFGPSHLNQIYFPIPPGEEQRLIIKNINGVIVNLERLLEKEETRIALLKEYRQSLISSVVTGKVRVTEDMI